MIIDEDFVAGSIEVGVVDVECPLLHQRLHRRHARFFLPGMRVNFRQQRPEQQETEKEQQADRAAGQQADRGVV